MSRKTLGGVLLVLGAALIVLGLVVMLVIVPGMKQFPDDVDTTRHYEGTVAVQLDPATFSFLTDLTVELERHFMTVETDGDLALVKEEQTLSTGGQPLQQIVKHHAIDRKSMEAVTDYPEEWSENEYIYGRAGLSLGWPIDSEKKDYDGWSDDYRTIVPLVYKGEQEHGGIDTYYFTSESTPQPIHADTVAVLKLPPALPTVALVGLVSGMEGMDPAIAEMFPMLIEEAGWPALVPLNYTYEYFGEYWVEPTTGVLIDTHKVEIRKVTVPQELMASLAEAIGKLPVQVDPAVLSGALPITIQHLEYQGTAESVEEAKKDAEDAKSQLQLFGTTLPIAAIVAGLLLAVVGIFMFTRP